MTMRSTPGADPPCGGAPNLKALIMPAKLVSTSSLLYPAISNALYMMSGLWFRIAPEESSTPLHTRSEEHTSELQSLMRISYAVFCLQKKTNNKTTHN